MERGGGEEREKMGSWMGLLPAMSYYECKFEGMAALVVCSVNQCSEASITLSAGHPPGKTKLLSQMTLLVGEKKQRDRKRGKETWLRGHSAEAKRGALSPVLGWFHFGSESIMASVLPSC